jgi:nitrogen fixation protein NifU and related proteins
MIENMDPNYLGEDDIYKENILDHFRNPRNFGEVVDAEIKNSQVNATCGDMIKLSVKLENGKIKDVKFNGNGCAISMASSSMLTEKLKGKTLDEVKKISNDDVVEMLGIELGVVRMKCGLLCLNTLNKGIEVMEKKNE